MAFLLDLYNVKKSELDINLKIGEFPIRIQIASWS